MYICFPPSSTVVVVVGFFLCCLFRPSSRLLTEYMDGEESIKGIEFIIHTSRLVCFDLDLTLTLAADVNNTADD